jgi:hypothetical protein
MTTTAGAGCSCNGSTRALSLLFPSVFIGVHLWLRSRPALHPPRNGPEHQRRAQVGQEILHPLPSRGTACVSPPRPSVRPPPLPPTTGHRPPTTASLRFGRPAPEDDFPGLINPQPLAGDLTGQPALPALLRNQAPVEQAEGFLLKALQARGTGLGAGLGLSNREPGTRLRSSSYGGRAGNRQLLFPQLGQPGVVGAVVEGVGGERVFAAVFKRATHPRPPLNSSSRFSVLRPQAPDSPVRSFLDSAGRPAPFAVADNWQLGTGNCRSALPLPLHK